MTALIRQRNILVATSTFGKISSNLSHLSTEIPKETIIVIVSYVIRDKYNIQLKDIVHYKIKKNVEDSDYEMIKKEQSEDFTINCKEKRELNKLASRQYEDILKINKYKLKGTNWITAIVTYKHSVMSDSKPSTTMSPITQHITQRKETSKNQSEEVYDYNKLLNEYYEESMSQAVFNETYHPTPDLKESYTLKKLVSFDTQTVNCKQSSEIGLKAVICLWNDYKAHTESSRALALRFWKIVKAWLFVYLAVAMPLWCTRGWCCCCLYCKFFKPYQTIEEAKYYLVINPPGVLHTRKGKKIEYELSEREKECYEEFEHLLKTI